MSICRQVCPWNTLYGCKKPDNEPCILSNMPCAGFEKKQTNADHIRAMSDEELARFLDDTQYREWEEIQENRQELVDFRSCVEGWTEWLKLPYKEAPNDPT